MFRLRVSFEEGTWAAWLHDLLKPHVSEVLMTAGKLRNRAKNACIRCSVIVNYNTSGRSKVITRS
jgi:hypothetical protein